MALQLKLVQRSDFTADVDDLDLLSFNEGFSTLEDGILPAVGVGDQPIDEVITVMAQGTSIDNLAVVLNTLEDKEQQILQYNDSEAQKYGVWLRTQLYGESYARQTLLRFLQHKPITSIYNCTAEKEYLAQQYQVALKRMPWWEAIESRDYTPGTDVSCVGGTIDYTTYAGGPGSVIGTLPARLAKMAFHGSATGGGPLYKFWAGFRTDRYGTRANFVPAWHIHDCPIRDNDTLLAADVADATAVGGFRATTTFATVTTLLRRVTARVGDITANYTDQRGRFTVLLRAKTTAAGTVRVRLADGIYNVATPADSQYRVGSRVPISSTSWQLYELGTVQIPTPGHLVGGTSYLEFYALGIDAELVSGSCDLDMDTLILIPMDEGFVYADGGAVQEQLGATRPLVVQQHADGNNSCVWFSTSSGRDNPHNIGNVSVINGMPIGAGLLVLAGQRAAVSTLADAVRLEMKVYPRWKTLRGNET